MIPNPSPSSCYPPCHCSSLAILPTNTSKFLSHTKLLPLPRIPPPMSLHVFPWLAPSHLSCLGLNIICWEKPHLKSQSKARPIPSKSSDFLLLVYFTVLSLHWKCVDPLFALWKLRSWLLSMEAAWKFTSLYFQLLLQCLGQSRYSVNIWWIKKWEWLYSESIELGTGGVHRAYERTQRN